MGMLSVLLAAVAAPRISVALVLGVAPENQAKYAGSTFACLSGSSVTLPASAINDDFCDCEDGSDEPGTSACAGQSTTLFHCPNMQSVPRMIYVSQVNDGICDCCDGSDEGKSKAGCANTCVEEGKAFHADRLQRTEVLQKGLSTKNQVMQDAQKKREEWRQEIARLKAELPNLEKAENDAKEANIIPPAVEARLSSMQANINSLKKEVEKLKKENAKLRAAAATGASAGAAGTEAAAAGGDKPQISEYTKWMDGAEKVVDKDGNRKSDVEVEAEDEDPPQDDEDDPKPATTSTADANDPAEVARKAVSENRKKTREVKEKMDGLPEDKLHFFSLIDTCVSKRLTEYEYKACFFKDAKQDHTSLGRWDSWTGPRSAVFKHGQMCPGGPEREMVVKFKCGVEPEVLEVSEPSRCIYEMLIAHPGACDEEDLKREQSVPAARMPKDEL